MGSLKTDYPKYFSVEQAATLAFTMEDGKDLEIQGVVTAVRGEMVTVECLGRVGASGPPLQPGDVTVFSARSNCEINRCTAIVAQLSGRKLGLRLFGNVEEQQRRQYFRLDLSMPFRYAVAEGGKFEAVVDAWLAEREKLLARGDNGKEILPEQANLSAGGIRFTTREKLDQGTYVTMTMFLATEPPRLVHTVGKVVRSNELQLEFGIAIRFTTALEFVCIDEGDRDAVITFLFSEQRRQLQRRRTA